MKRPLLVFAFTVRCATQPVTTPEVAFSEFEIARARVKLVRNVPDSWKAEDFFYIAHPQEEVRNGCGAYTNGFGHLVYGEFQQPYFIHYCETCTRVIRHEIGHALLWRLGDKWYFCWEHLALKEAGIERFQPCPIEYLNPGGNP